MKLSLIPLLPFTVAFIGGILLQGCGMSGFFIFLPLGAAIVAVLLRRHYAAILFAALCLGATVADLHSPHPLQVGLAGRNAGFSGVATEVRRYEPTQVIIVDIDSCDGKSVRPFRIKIYVPSSVPTVDERQRIAFAARLSPLDFDPDLPDEIDYNARLRLNGVVGQTLVSPDSLSILCPEPGLFNSIRHQREKVTLLIARSPLNSDTKAFLNAALTGDRSMLAPNTHDMFSVTGLSHILALSGLHVGILVMILSVMLLPLYLCDMRRLRTVLLIALLWAFAIMTGLTPSVVRAVIMATVFMLSVLLQRVRAPFNSLCLAALLILLFTPHALYTIGFQLSFFAVAAILLFAEKLNPFSRRQTIARSLASYPAVTLAAILGTGIVSAYYFHIFPLYSLPVNFVCALLLPFILSGGIVLLLANAAGFPCLWLAGLTDSLYGVILRISEAVSTLPGAVADGLLITPLTLAAWFLTLTAIAMWLYKRRAAYATATLLLALFTAFTLFVGGNTVGPGAEVYIPRTGRQTSLLIRHNRSLMLATTAPRHETGDITGTYSQRYGLFMLKRGIDSIRPLPAHCHSPLFRREDNLFIFTPTSGPANGATGDAGFTILLIYDRSQVVPQTRHIDYALVCNGFRGKIEEIAAEIRPDTILLSADLNRRRHDRYLRELSAARIPHRTLRDSPFSKTLLPPPVPSPTE